MDLTRNDTVSEEDALYYPGMDLWSQEFVEYSTAEPGTTCFPTSGERLSSIHTTLLRRGQHTNGQSEFPPYPFLENDTGFIPYTGATSGFMDMHPQFLRREFDSSPSLPGDSDLSWMSESEGSFSPAPSGCSLKDLLQAVDLWEPGPGHGLEYEPQSMHDFQNVPDIDIDPELQAPYGVTNQNMLGQGEKALSRCLEDMKVDTDIDGEISMKDGDAREDSMQRTPLAAITRPMAGYTCSRKPDSNRAGKCAIKRPKQNKSKSRSESRDSTTKRIFACSFAHYGCESAFPSKNEWKRHITSQHLQLGFYRCDVGDCKPSISKNNRYTMNNDGDRAYNDFNRKDLFTQHQRRMHAPWLVETGLKPSKLEENAFEASLDAVRSRCWHEKRKPPQQSQCGFCGKEFSGPRSWDERMEHVGKHFEKGENNNEREDPELRMWALQEGIICPAGDNKWVLSSLQPSKG
ncbi:hypothetical protein Plec18167_003362 [Paecilomyces lecythidis]|uniref:Uncharacterized protein n=1 Tax=Paecilomyces lecythidis TaxID=3004212 RepID=A0ABR3XZ56_9EURO